MKAGLTPGFFCAEGKSDRGFETATLKLVYGDRASAIDDPKSRDMRALPPKRKNDACALPRPSSSRRWCCRPCEHIISVNGPPGGREAAQLRRVGRGRGEEGVAGGA